MANIDSCEYIFRVKGSNNDGLFSDETTIPLTVARPFWSTVSILIITGTLLIFGIGFGTYGITMFGRQLERRKQERKLAQLQELNKKKDEFLDIASHELRTPLAHIKGAIELVLGGKTGPITIAQRKKLRAILKNANQGVRLADNLLNLSCIVHKRTDLTLEIHDIGELIDEVIQGFEDEQKINEGHLRLSFPSERIDLEIKLDKPKAEQVLWNIIGNAIKFTKTGTITVLAKATKTCIKVQVIDTGRGISKNEQSKIFDQYYKVPEALGGRVDGTGIGLNIAKEFVELHSGKIWVESEKGKGATFTFTIPKI
ncbi:HAMP domain-containing sensor histidine kinase [Anaerolineales bacterium HSG25]|nr:HAMP domain-containing sensor histidine kinase [Anaerolineales bacterium HSG25]